MSPVPVLDTGSKCHYFCENLFRSQPKRLPIRYGSAARWFSLIYVKCPLCAGIITFVNYNARVPPKVSQLTLAHEIGHNFGSPHDYPADCRPGKSTGLCSTFLEACNASSVGHATNEQFILWTNKIKLWCGDGLDRGEMWLVFHCSWIIVPD